MSNIYHIELDYYKIEKIALRLVAYSLAFTCGADMI